MCGADCFRNTSRDIQVLKTYGAAPYAASLKKLEKDVKDLQTKVNEKIGMYFFKMPTELINMC